MTGPPKDKDILVLATIDKNIFILHPHFTEIRSICKLTFLQKISRHFMHF
jgi:hypothetical protein